MIGYAVVLAVAAGTTLLLTPIVMLLARRYGVVVEPDERRMQSMPISTLGGSALFLFADRLFKAGYLDGSNIGPLIAIIAVGMCVGFLPFNFNKAKIIMGDAGALLLGLMLAVPTITVGGRTDVQFSGNTYF